MRTLARLLLIGVTIALLWQAGHLIAASLKRTDTPVKIMQEAGLYLVIMFVVSRCYRKL